MSGRRFLFIERLVERNDKEYRELIVGLSRGQDDILKRVAELEKSREPDEAEMGPRTKVARIPPRPPVMQEAGVGKDPK